MSGPFFIYVPEIRFVNGEFQQTSFFSERKRIHDLIFYQGKFCVFIKANFVFWLQVLSKWSIIKDDYNELV